MFFCTAGFPGKGGGIVGTRAIYEDSKVGAVVGRLLV